MQITRQILRDPAIIGMLLALLVGEAATAYVAQKSEEADRWVAHTLQVRATVAQLGSFVRDMEIGQRGYLLTGDVSYRSSFVDSRKTIQGSLARLRVLTADNQIQQDRLDAFGPLLESRYALASQTIQLMDEGKTDEAVSLVRSGQGQSLMTMIWQQLDAVVRQEVDLLSERQDNAVRLRSMLYWAVALSMVLVLILATRFARAQAIETREAEKRSKILEGEIQRREIAEATLRQSQKMEAVGQLTGGIAHDFNNHLTIVMGNVDTALRRFAAADDIPSERRAKLVAPLDHAMQAARAAAQLTQRLLAFSRRQALNPAQLDMNRLVSGMTDLIRRTLDENIHVETVLAGGLWPTHADSNQLENALVNVVVNARDAMPNGGRLTIETSNAFLDEAYVARFADIKAGQYVLLSVADNGAGISPENLEHVFEPFFTTKLPEHGTGLGLAMVHGFVKQSGGHVRIYSEVGQGTTVKIYLPRLMEAVVMPSTPAAEPVSMDMERAREGEVVFVVEDNEGVRRYACEALADLGYMTIEAGTGPEALVLVQNAARIDVLFTDVVLAGGMTGRQLAEKFTVDRPDVPVLFTTGYTRNAIVHHGRLDPGVELLGKPYTQQDLARKLRQVIDKAAAAKVIDFPRAEDTA